MIRKIIWSDNARTDVRAMDRETGLQLLKSLARFKATEAGDVIQLHGFNPPLYRLRIGAWRVIYKKHAEGIEIVAVRNRKEAYR